MQSKSLEEELSAHFCGARADKENPEVVFFLPKAIRQYPKLQICSRILVLEIRIRNADINALFAFVIAKNGIVLGKGNIAVTKDANNRILWHGYGQPLYLLHSKKGGFCLQAENHLYIFGLLPGYNRYEIYKAEVRLAGKCGRLLWQKVCEGQCFCQGRTIATEQKNYEEWPALAGLFENQSFQDKLRPYILGGQIPQK